MTKRYAFILQYLLDSLLSSGQLWNPDEGVFTSLLPPYITLHHPPTPASAGVSSSAQACKASTPEVSCFLWFITPRAPCPTWLYVAAQVAVQWCVQALISFWINESFKKSYLIPQRSINPFMGLKRIVHSRILKLLPTYYHSFRLTLSFKILIDFCNSPLIDIKKQLHFPGCKSASLPILNSSSL